MNTTPKKTDPLLVVVLRTAVLAFAFCAFAWDISTWVGQTSIVLGSIVGSVAAHRLAKSRWALWRAWALALGVGAAGLMSSWTITNTSLFVLFNPATQLHFAEFLKLGAVAFTLVCGLRTQSARYPQLVAFEFGLAAVCMASSMAMHRDGAINRPTELGDYAWGLGEDPARYIIYAGLVASVAGLLMLFREKKLWRTAIHLTVMALLFGAVLTVVEDVDLPRPEARQTNPRDQEDWLDPNLEPVWGPDKGDLDGMDNGEDGKGKGNKGERQDEGGKGEEPRYGDRGERPESDPWSEFDDGYISEQVGDGSGQGDGSGGGGSGSKPPWKDSFEPDTDATKSPPGGGRIVQVYTPDIIPLDRGNVFDGIKEDETFTHRDEERKPVKLSKASVDPEKDPVAKFDGDVRLRLRPGYVTPLPSVSPDMRITAWEAKPEVKIEFSKDGADNFWVSSDTAATVHLTFKVEAPMPYFGGKLPETFDLEAVPDEMLMPMPEATRQDAVDVMAALGVTEDVPRKEAFLRMVEYFRSFEDVDIPDKPEDRSYYEHLALEHKGVCRHRAYAFVITANAFGIPTRFITNDIHAFAESWIPGYGWLQLDLGGRELDMQVTGPSENDPFIPPRTDLPEPESFQKNREAFNDRKNDPRRRREPRKQRKRLTPEEFAKKYPERCRKKRKKEKLRSPKHDWAYTRGQTTPISVSVLHGEHSPPSGNYFFRQRARSYYDGCRFIYSRRRDTDNDLLTRFPTGDKVMEVRNPPPYVHRSALDMTTGDMVTRRRPVTLEGVFAAKKTDNPDHSRFFKVMRTQHMVHTTPFPELLGKDVGSREWGRSQWGYYLRKPIDPVYKQLADEAVAKLPDDKKGDPIAQAAAILTFLEDTGTLDTSRSYADEETEDPTAAFLKDEQRRGHQVHFSHAMALMLRTRGIPTRLVEGYVSPEANRRGGSAIMLREVDAHIWPEMYVNEVGWIPVDPVPRKSVSEGVAPPDPELQRMLGEILRGQYEPDEDEDAGTTRKATNTLGVIGRGILHGFGYLLLLALLLVMPATIGTKLWRRAAAGAASDNKAHRLVFRATLDRLAEAGIVREFGEPREAFAERVADRLPSLLPHTHAHMRAFLGAADDRLGDKATHVELARKVKQELKGAVPWWRRVVGFFNPMTLWKAR